MNKAEKVYSIYHKHIIIYNRSCKERAFCICLYKFIRDFCFPLSSDIKILSRSP